MGKRLSLTWTCHIPALNEVNTSALLLMGNDSGMFLMMVLGLDVTSNNLPRFEQILWEMVLVNSHSVELEFKDD